MARHDGVMRRKNSKIEGGLSKTDKNVQLVPANLGTNATKAVPTLSVVDLPLATQSR